MQLFQNIILNDNSLCPFSMNLARESLKTLLLNETVSLKLKEDVCQLIHLSCMKLIHLQISILSTRASSHDPSLHENLADLLIKRD